MRLLRVGHGSIHQEEVNKLVIEKKLNEVVEKANSDFECVER